MAYAHSTAVIATPIGVIEIDVDEEALLAIRIDPAERAEAGAAVPLLREAKRQIDAYFGGHLRKFDLPLRAPTTPRGAALRDAILSIGYSETLGYGALAARIGSSARAIGQACARNPYPLVVPCHRVLAANARLGHYSAGAGIETKAWLLRHEGSKGWRT